MKQAPPDTRTSPGTEDAGQGAGPWRIPDLVALAAAVLLGVLLCVRQISAVDFWWQLETGAYVLREGWPQTDAFSFTVTDHSWVELRWLYGVALHILVGAGGAAAAILVKTIAVLATLGLLLGATVTRRTLGAAIWMGILSLLAMNNRLYVRPELVTYFFLAVYLVAIHRDRERGTRWTFALPVLQIVWVNAHTLFVLGPAVVGAWLVAEAGARGLGREKGDGRPDLLKRSGVVLGLCAAACVVNPWFFRGAMFPLELFRQLQSTGYSSYIEELRSPFTFLVGNVAVPFYLVILVVTVATALASVRRLDPFWTVVTAAFGYLSLTAVRNVPLFVIAAAPFVVLHLRGEAFQAAWLSRIRRRLHPVAAGVAVVACLLLSWTLVTNRFTVDQSDSNRFGFGINPYRFPVGAVDFLEENGVRGERVFCNLNEGSYLLHRGYRVFFDPRLEVYGEEQLRAYQDAVATEEGWRRVEEKYEFPIAFIGLAGQGEIALAKRLRDSGRWRLVYLDHAAAVLLATRFAPGIPDVDFDGAQAAWLARWRTWLPEALSRGEAGWFRPLDPPYPYQQMGRVLRSFGRDDLAEPFLRDALRAGPDLYDPNAILGQLSLRKGRFEEAVRLLDRARRNAPWGSSPGPEERGKALALDYYFFTARAKLHESRGDAEAAKRDRETASRLAAQLQSS